MFKKIKYVIFFLLFCSMSFTAVMVFAAAQKEQISSAEYQDRPVLETSLFQSDRSVLGEEAIARILKSKFVLPPKIKIAILKMPENKHKALQYYGYAYWRAEAYLKTQQSFIETISNEIDKSERVLEVASLPAILTPKNPDISNIREMAVRLQADMLLVFQLNSDVYQKYRLFMPDQVKAFCTCEGFLLDTRTGLIPFSKIVTKELMTTKTASDANFTETIVRAENEAALLALSDLGKEIGEFVKLVPYEIVPIQPEEAINID